MHILFNLGSYLHLLWYISRSNKCRADNLNWIYRNKRIEKAALTYVLDYSERISAKVIFRNAAHLTTPNRTHISIKFYSALTLNAHIFCKIFPTLSESKHLCICTGPLACAWVEFYDFMHRERSIMAWAKRLKKGDINHKAVGEWKAEIEGRCAGERRKRIGSCGLRLRLCTWTDTVCRADWIWLAE